MKKLITYCKLLGLISLLWIVFFGSRCSFFAQSSDQTKKPVYNIDNNSFIGEWLILGPFPNPVSEEPLPNGSSQTGFYKDYLQSIGGESQVEFTENIEITFSDHNKPQQSVRPVLLQTGEKGIIDFEKYYGQVDHKVAYAFCYIHSELDQEAMFLFGSDDGARVWINGTLVHDMDIGRGLKLREDKFRVKLNKGLNPVLIKISEMVREWAFALEAFTTAGYRIIEERERYLADFNTFLNCRLIPKQSNTWNYVFGPGDFPELEWEKPYLVEKLFGKFQLNIRWFDKQLNEVDKAEKPGRYAFYAEGRTAEGLQIRRAGTLYCMPWGWMAWAERPKARLDYIPLSEFNKASWEEHKEVIADFAGRIVLLSMMDQTEGAILLSYLDEMKSSTNKGDLLNTPIIKDHEYHLKLKRRILGVQSKWPSLESPTQVTNNPGAIIREGITTEAAVKKGTREKIKNICQKWFEESGEPFNVTVARKGVIIIHEAFGKNAAGRITKETTTEIASITKLLTGVLFTQFVDQGLINVDDPVGKYLPDFPVDGEKILTLRHCFTHTSGFWGHEEWGGLHDPWLDNKMANIFNELTIGEKYEYNGMGYNLAGKVMEMVSGKSIFRLMREYLFDPLNLKKTVLEEDLGFGCHSNAGELAVIGQLLLNRGTYGNLKFFSSQTFEKFLPKPLNNYYSGINVEQGIGITWMRQTHPDAGIDGIPEGQTILSNKVIGHGSATATILRVDLDNDLVICQTRRRAGKSYNKYLEKFLLAIEQGL